MCGSVVLHEVSVKPACSGKCAGGGGCGSAPRILVLAACGGMTALFEKKGGRALSRVAAVASSTEQFQQLLDAIQQRPSFQQLLLVGSDKDLMWLQMLLPDHVLKHISAEIRQSLTPQWFSESNGERLTTALQELLV